jgi:predicted ribosomally synthesized peptide with nif11-like leader
MAIAEAIRLLQAMKTDHELFWSICLIHDKDARAAAIRAAGFDCTPGEVAEVCASPFEDHGPGCDGLF